jgi:hypothetical protein
MRTLLYGVCLFNDAVSNWTVWNEEEYRALVEWQLKNEAKLLGEKPVPLPLRPPQIPHRDRTDDSVVRS